MRKNLLIVVSVVLVTLLLVSLTAFAAPARYTVRSKIGGTQYGATQELSHFRIGPGNYVLLVGGRPGSSAEISFTGVNVTLE